jgi:hypothetical protein
VLAHVHAGVCGKRQRDQFSTVRSNCVALQCVYSTVFIGSFIYLYAHGRIYTPMGARGQAWACVGGRAMRG